MKNRIFIYALLSVLVGCARSEAVSTFISTTATHDEFVLSAKFVGAGGPCTGPQLPNRYESSDWLYLPKGARGKLRVEDIVVTNERSDLAGPSRKKFISGSVEYDGSTMRVDLLQPKFDQAGKIVGEQAYKHNGTYVVRIPPPPPSK